MTNYKTKDLGDKRFRITLDDESEFVLDLDKDAITLGLRFIAVKLTSDTLIHAFQTIPIEMGAVEAPADKALVAIVDFLAKRTNLDYRNRDMWHYTIAEVIAICPNQTWIDIKYLWGDVSRIDFSRG